MDGPAVPNARAVRGKKGDFDGDVCLNPGFQGTASGRKIHEKSPD
jgi:hypothetical protein